MAGAAPFHYTRKARSWTALLTLLAIYITLLVLWLAFGAAWWIVLGLTIPTLPALWEFRANTTAGLSLDAETLSWHSGRRTGALALSEIGHMRLDTRWDFSVRATAILRDDKQVRLPHESLPPHRAFEAALQARGIEVKRRHFAIL